MDEVIIENSDIDKNVRDDNDEEEALNQKTTKKSTSKMFNSFSFSNEYDSFTTTIQTTKTDKPRSFIESILGTESASSASSLFNRSYNTLFATRLFLTLFIILFHLR